MTKKFSILYQLGQFINTTKILYLQYNQIFPEFFKKEMEFYLKFKNKNAALQNLICVSNSFYQIVTWVISDYV